MNKIITILLGIFGFASISLFLMWGTLHLIGEPEAAKEVKTLPNTIEGIREDATRETVNVLSGAVIDLNEEREKAVANEEDKNLKRVINLIYLAVIVQFVVAILALFGIKIK